VFFVKFLRFIQVFLFKKFNLPAESLGTDIGANGIIYCITNHRGDT
jgi:hypothetical protein